MRSFLLAGSALVSMLSIVGLGAFMACSAGTEKGGTPPALDSGGLQLDAGDSSFNFDGADFPDVAPGEVSPIIPDPTTCAEAAASKTYVGCDFWPTVTDNIVNPIFDFAAVVANTGSTEATIEVTRLGKTVATAKVPANGLEKIYLPWVEELKSTMPNNGCPTNLKTSTVRANGGAYHLTSSVPVAVYQFNPLQYAGKGGPAGKDWATLCSTKNCLGLVKCFSYTNDASLLLPSTALTGNYRVAGTAKWTDDMFTYPPYFAVTGTKAGTKVTVKLGKLGGVAAGAGIPSAPPGGTITFDLNAGDVVQVLGTTTGDFSGTLVNATEPVQIITGIGCTQMPDGIVACDHVEESLLPVETLGKHYFVTVPSAPATSPKEHVVRFYGNVDGTVLTYPGAKPAGAPSKIDAGEMVEITGVKTDFEIVGDHELTIATFLTGAGPITGSAKGDPSQSFAVAVEQYRLKYVFLAPDDYDNNYVDIVMPMDAEVMLDGAKLSVIPTALSSGHGIAKVALGPGKNGAHVITSNKPVGIQVLGYGSYTSYQYPGGLNLGRIAPPPIK